MAMCYQKQGLLEEAEYCLIKCIHYISGWAQHEKSVSIRMSNLKRECKYRMQLCAISSQINKHKDALEQAKIAVQIVH